MITYENGNTTVIVIFHEIYGVNTFIKDTCVFYHKLGYDVICPDLYEGVVFSYDDKEAYAYFCEHVSFDVNYKNFDFINTLYKKYQHVILLGFSAGATLAWNCSTVYKVDALIGCYGSRIRDYVHVQPKCPVLNIFASEDSFDVFALVKQLNEKTKVRNLIVQAHHGFMDAYSLYYHKEVAMQITLEIISFIKEHTQ